jgi:hypothetical protein
MDASQVFIAVVLVTLLGRLVWGRYPVASHLANRLLERSDEIVRRRYTKSPTVAYNLIINVTCKIYSNGYNHAADSENLVLGRYFKEKLWGTVRRFMSLPKTFGVIHSGLCTQ